MVDNPFSFAPTRAKDENDLLKQLIVAFDGAIIRSNHSLNIFDINAVFGVVEAMFMNFRHKFDEDKQEEIEKLINGFKRGYASILGIIQDEKEAKGNLVDLYNLNERVKTIFTKVMEVLK